MPPGEEGPVSLAQSGYSERKWLAYPCQGAQLVSRPSGGDSYVPAEPASRRRRGQDRLSAGYWSAEPLRHDREDLHLWQMRSPAHALLNGRRQARQSRTLGSMSPSGTGFL